MSDPKKDGYIDEAKKLIARHLANTKSDKMTAFQIREDAISLARSALSISEAQVSKLQKVTFTPQSRTVSENEALEHGMNVLGVRLNNLLYEIGLESSPVLQRPDEISVRWLINHLKIQHWLWALTFIVTIFYFGIVFGDTTFGIWVKQHASWIK